MHHIAPPPQNLHTHLHQHLVDDARALVPRSSSPARRAQRVKLVDEKHRGRKVSKHLKRLPDAARPDARVDVVEVRARAREHLDPRLGRDGLGEQGLAGSWRPGQQDAADAADAAQAQEGGVLEVVDDLLDLVLDLFV